MHSYLPNGSPLEAFEACLDRNHLELIFFSQSGGRSSGLLSAGLGNAILFLPGYSTHPGKISLPCYVS